MGLIIFLIFFCLANNVSAIKFQDVSTAVGLRRPYGPRIKYGGPIVADFNGDGFPDLLISHHDQFSADLYFNNQNGKFSKAPWKFWRDTHGFAAFHPTPRTKSMSFFASVGGNYGRKPSLPVLFNVSPNKKIVHSKIKFFPSGRGREILPVSLSNKPSGVIDFIVFNAVPNQKYKQQNFAGSFFNNNLHHRVLKGFSNNKNSFGTVADVNMDSTMEIISYHQLKVHRIINSFILKDISSKVLPRHLDYRGTISVSEFDYNNDGLMDLYIARSATNDVSWLKKVFGPNPNDYLLKNVGGRYIDVSRKARIPKGGESRGVTAADFNNDGNIDLLVTQYIGRDRLLINNGDGSFRYVDPGYQKSMKTRGDQPVAVDYNRDGRVDLILSEGHFFNRGHGGFMRVMKNIGGIGNWILIRVGSSPDLKASSLHALVILNAGTRKMIRRVGSPGSTTGNSYIELIHFGLGSWKNLVTVSVRWTNKYTVTKKNVRINKVTSIGVV